MYAHHSPHAASFSSSSSPANSFAPSPCMSTPPSAQASSFSSFGKVAHSSSNSSLDTSGSGNGLAGDPYGAFAARPPAYPAGSRTASGSTTSAPTAYPATYSAARPSPGIQGAGPSLEALGFTGAYNHHSSIIKLHSYTPSFHSADPAINLAHFSPSPPGDLEVNCTLLLSPTSMLASASSSSSASNQSAYDPSRPKIIRVCFSSRPVATYVSRAPADSITHPPSAPEDQDLVLSCSIPSWAELVEHGAVSAQSVDRSGTGRVGLFCEILAGGAAVAAGEEQVLERLWFGDFAFMMGGADYADGGVVPVEGLAIGGWAAGESGYLAPPQHSYHTDGPPSLPARHSWSHPQPTPPEEAKYTYSGIAAAQEKSFQVNINTSELRPPSYASPSDLSGPHSAPPFHHDPHAYHHAPAPARSAPTPPPPAAPPAPPAAPTILKQASVHLQQSSSAPVPTTFYRHAMVAAATKVPSSPMKAPRAAKSSSSSSLGGSSAGAGSASPIAVPVGKKASLHLHGDLLAMTSGWHEDEWNSRRRLVQFWRKLEGSTIHATWAPVSQANYVENTIVVSCIFRDETNECYVTSVDAIYLLEALVGGRFSVEEKNRIRRNLERCKPDTMSKTKDETRDFFALIMGFPKPKPRNIEKDVKVFRWSDLPGALAKSIAKYSITEGPPNGALPGVTSIAHAVDDGQAEY